MEKVNEIDERTASEDLIELPNLIEGIEVLWEEKKESQGLSILLMGIVLAIITFLIYDKDLYDKVKERNRQMLLDYPEIINKLTLLGGMPLKMHGTK